MHPIYTIGHSTRIIEEFTALLEKHHIDLLVDVRRFPGSRRHPQFNKGNISDSLEEAGIDYRHMEVLGGRRGKPAPDSPNDGWRSDGFQAYADYLDTSDAQQSIDELMTLAEAYTTALMCAEAVWWRCHRQLIADALVARNVNVCHILGPDNLDEHDLNDMARILDDGRIIYPDPSGQRELFEDST